MTATSATTATGEMEMDNLEELKKINGFLNDFWRMIKSSYDLPTGDADQYWQDLMRYADLLCKKYDDHKLVKKLLMAYLDYQEETWRTQKDM